MYETVFDLRYYESKALKIKYKWFYEHKYTKKSEH